MVPGTFNNKSFGQQTEMVCGLVLLGQFLQAHSGTHALGVPVAALHIVHFGHQQQSLVQVLGLEGRRKELLRLRPCKVKFISFKIRIFPVGIRQDGQENVYKRTNKEVMLANK